MRMLARKRRRSRGAPCASPSAACVAVLMIEAGIASARPRPTGAGPSARPAPAADLGEQARIVERQARSAGRQHVDRTGARIGGVAEARAISDQLREVASGQPGEAALVGGPVEAILAVAFDALPVDLGGGHRLARHGFDGIAGDFDHLADERCSSRQDRPCSAPRNRRAGRASALGIEQDGDAIGVAAVGDRMRALGRRSARPRPGRGHLVSPPTVRATPGADWSASW